MTTEKELRQKYMEEALKEARKAFDEGEIPVGCVIVHGEKIIARAHNTVERDGCALGHAEINAIKEASMFLKEKFLSKCDLFVTVEPCAMCAGAILNARIGQLFFGTEEPKTGCCGSNYNLTEDTRFNCRVRVYNENDMECRKLMQEFFDNRRGKC